jgi:hypothetical protein
LFIVSYLFERVAFYHCFCVPAAPNAKCRCPRSISFSPSLRHIFDVFADGSALKLRTLFEQIADEMKKPIGGCSNVRQPIILHHVEALRAVAQHLQPSAAEQLLRELEENARSRGEADFQRRALKEIVEGVITGTVHMGSSYFGPNPMELGPLGVFLACPCPIDRWYLEPPRALVTDAGGTALSAGQLLSAPWGAHRW